MPTAGSQEITAAVGFFDAARTTIAPEEALRFKALLIAANDGVWDNIAKLLTSVSLDCVLPHVGAVVHVWMPDPLEHGWDEVSECVGEISPIAWHLPLLVLPSGPGYSATIGQGDPLTLQGIHNQLRTHFAGTRAYALRFGLLWTSVQPSDLLHNHQVIHFNGWPD